VDVFAQVFGKGFVVIKAAVFTTQAVDVQAQVHYAEALK
jgi:hypothetical protein